MNELFPVETLYGAIGALIEAMEFDNVPIWRASRELPGYWAAVNSCRCEIEREYLTRYLNYSEVDELLLLLEDEFEYDYAEEDLESIEAEPEAYVDSRFGDLPRIKELLKLALDEGAK